ncbi:MAG: carbon storage regulator [Gimesia sp.]|nr:carbon storage regulator [Gimesia sp.]
MLVLSRKTDESLCIDDLEITVGWIRYNKVQLIIDDSGEVEPVEQILYVEEKHELAPEITIIVILITEDKVRLGIEAPPGTRMYRGEHP